jgi:Uma2 family endonuclease
MTATPQLALDDDLDYEVVDGQKKVKMAGAKHGRIGSRLIFKLEAYLEQNPIGGVYISNTTFQIGSNERMPDVSFVSAARIPEEGEPSGKGEIAPDIAVEVISPNDVWYKSIAKCASISRRVCGKSGWFRSRSSK